jgi:hypothetical protein
MVDRIAEQLPLFAGIDPDDGFDFAELAKLYPKIEGRTKGVEALKKKLKKKSEYLRFKRAMLNYVELCEIKKTPKEFIKHFSTFVNCWQDYEFVDLLKETQSENSTLMELVERGEI